MQDDINVLITFLNDLASEQKDIDILNKIIIVHMYKQAMDIENGDKYLSLIIKDPNVIKHLKFKIQQNRTDSNNQTISEQMSFIQNCNAVIDAMAKSILENKIKDEFKNQTSPNFKNFTEWVEFYKNILK